MSMPTVFACLVCGRPIDALLTGGLHAGVAVMAVVAVAVVAVIAGVVRQLLREDAAMLERSSAEGDGR
jgi:hypothetical protein